MFFRDVIGQEDVKQRLIHSVKTGQIAHAQLFCGPEGVGKFPLALAYARYIQCTNKGENDACGQCPSCKQYNNLMHPDLHFVFPIVKNEKKKKRVSDDYIEDWRLFLAENTYFNLDQWLEYIDAANSQAMIYAEESREIIRKISLKTYESDYKVMIIWLPERMNAVCANKLLKLLEEPYDKHFRFTFSLPVQQIVNNSFLLLQYVPLEYFIVSIQCGEYIIFLRFQSL